LPARSQIVSQMRLDKAGDRMSEHPMPHRVGMKRVGLKEIQLGQPSTTRRCEEESFRLKHGQVTPLSEVIKQTTMGLRDRISGVNDEQFNASALRKISELFEGLSAVDIGHSNQWIRVGHKRHLAGRLVR
jgi:hypothetical protein